MDTGNLFQAFNISASGLSAQRARVNVISSNIANAQTTRTPGGGPYQRRVVSMAAEGATQSDLFASLLHAQRSLSLEVSKTSSRHAGDAEILRLDDPKPSLAFEVGVDQDTPTRLEYEPGHPDANEDGYVEYPNVEVIREMVDLMTASRAYEANVTVLNSTKSMLQKALEI